MFPNIILFAFALIAIGAILLLSPEIILPEDSKNSTIKKIREYSMYIGLALVGGGGYLYWTNTKKTTFSDSPKIIDDDITTITGSKDFE